jgi:hypothetical protein
MHKISFRRTAVITLMIMAIPALLLATHSWGGYHWARTSNPFTLKLGDNLTTADWKSHLTQTSSDWNSGNTPVITAIVAGSSTRRCKKWPVRPKSVMANMAIMDG